MLGSPKFPPLEKGRETQKGLPSETEKGKKPTLDLARRDSYNALAYNSSYDTSEELATVGW